MCDPITIATAVALTAGGTALQADARSDARKKANSLRIENDEKNNRIIQNLQAQQQGAAKTFTPENITASQEEDADGIANIIKEGITDGFSASDFGIKSTPQIVQRSDAQESDESAKFTSGFADALANLRSFDETMLDRSFSLNRLRENSQLQSGFIGGNNDVLEAGLSNIDPSSPLGDIAVSLGTQALTSGFGAPGSSPLAKGGATGLGGSKAAMLPGQKIGIARGPTNPFGGLPKSFI